MPWCPRCDEVFPQGPACPRCSARLIDHERTTASDGLSSVGDLASIKVSRRYRRAFERLSGPRPTPSPRLFVAALVALVFAVGFLLGRMGSIAPTQPTVRELAPVAPLAFEEISGSATYLLASSEPLLTIASHDLVEGDVTARARFSPPFAMSNEQRTQVTALGSSVAVIVGEGRRSYVAVIAEGRTVTAWIRGVEAAWETEDRLLIRRADGTLIEWSGDEDDGPRPVDQHADHLFQTSDGAIVLRSLPNEIGGPSSGRYLESSSSSEDVLKVPAEVSVLATNGDRAIVDVDEPAVWDGKNLRGVGIDGYVAIAASFERQGDRAAVVLRKEQGSDLFLAIVDGQGEAAIKPLRTRVTDCTATPVWDAAGKWVYVAAGDGELRAVEAGGGRTEAVRTRAVGCGVAWMDR